MAAMLNAGITPVVHEHGSLGCSGDLAPLSHCALALMGEGPVRDADGALVPAADALAAAGYQRVEFVESPGEFAVRGAVLDFHALEPAVAYRVLYDEDRVASIRPFDPISQEPQAVIAQAVATVAFPTFSAQAAAGQFDLLRRTFERTLRMVFFLVAPATLGLLVLLLEWWYYHRRTV